MEYSPFALYIEDEKLAILKTARELGITIVAYSPLARGMITGRFVCHSIWIIVHSLNINVFLYRHPLKILGRMIPGNVSLSTHQWLRIFISLNGAIFWQVQERKLSQDLGCG
jgi:hypothetical protein